MRKEYDFSKGVRGKYAERFARTTNVVVIDSDLSKKFPNSGSQRRAAKAPRDFTPKKSVKQFGYTTIFEPLPEGGFSVVIPAIPEICTFGRTIEEAREMARDAIRCFLESALLTGEPIPPTSAPVTTEFFF